MDDLRRARKFLASLTALLSLSAAGLGAWRATSQPAAESDRARGELRLEVLAPLEPPSEQPAEAAPGALSASARPEDDTGDEDPEARTDWRVLGASQLAARRDRAPQGFLRQRILHFTFDDGPHLDTTPQLLDSLAEHDVRATFFVVGKQLAGPRSLERRALLQRIEDEGHTVAVHTNGHGDLRRMTAEQIRGDLDRVERSLEATLGYRPGLFRPPYGRRTSLSNEILRQRGYTQVLWNLPPEQGARSAQDILRHFRQVLDRRERHPRGPGGIVLLHDPHSASVEAFPLLMDELRRRNCALLDRQGEELWDVSRDLRPFLLHDGELPTEELAQRQLEARRRATALCAELAGETAAAPDSAE